MSEVSFTNNSFDSLLNESLQETSELRNQVIKLTNKNEEYQQQIHVLRRELDSTNSMYKEVKELLEEVSSQQSEKIDQKVQELTDKHNHERKHYEKCIEELEEDLTSKIKEIEELQINISELKLKIKLPPIQEQTIYEDNSEQQENKIIELMTLLQEKENKLFQNEEIYKNLQTQISEQQDIIQSYKIRIEEKDQIIESTQEELVICRLELNTLRTTPITGAVKGNSLFAEVEDRRQITMEKMNSMRSSYLEMKRSYLSKENEIKVLKTERAALIRKWEDSAIEAVEQETALVDAYKKRITDLENKLKEEQKKHKQFQNEIQQPDSNMSYFRSLLNSKKEEIEKLHMQIEDNAIRTLLEEEKSHKFGKRLRYWRYKAMSLEASLLAVQSELQANSNSSTVEILQIIKNQMSDKTLNVDNEDDEIELSLKPKILDETKVSMDSLIHPKPFFLPNLDSTLSSEMSLTNIDDSTFVLNQIVLPTNDKKSLSKISETLNNTTDMSLTQMIETESPDTTLKIQFEEDMTNFRPTSTSSCLQEKTSNIEFHPLNHYSCYNKENVPTVASTSILKSALAKSTKEQDEQKEKKALRFTEDTRDPKEGYIKRLKKQQKQYPVVFISSKSNK